MPNFSPSGIIHIGTVPFDNTYRHTMTFGSASEQQSYFASVCNRALDRDDYVYVRMNNSIRVPFNAEDLYGYNYVMYQNANYGTKWFYAFIVGCHYDNKETTTLDLELDVMQTWYFDYTLTQGFVEREHVNDDTIGAHTLAEPAMPLVYTAERSNPITIDNRYMIVQTAQIPSEDTSLWTQLTSPTKTVSGGYYTGVFSGGKYLAFDMSDENGRNDAKAFFQIMNMTGAADAISSVFMYPKRFCPNVGGDYGIEENTDPITSYLGVIPPTDLDGYVPHNNKLFTYPYNYCLLSDNNGQTIEYRYEMWGTTDKTGQSQRTLVLYTALSPNATLVVAPMEYDGLNVNTIEGMSMPITTQCSWTYSGYQNWLAQNALTNATSLTASVLPFAVGASTGLGAAATYLGLGSAVASLGNEDAVGVSGELAYRSTGNLTMNTALATNSVLGNVANIQRMSMTPNTVKGTSSEPTLVANNLQQPLLVDMQLRAEYAKMVDGFFDMFGYEVDSVKVPNRTGRPAWNYVKMRNSCHRGKVPAQDMARINSIYDAGITFWHTPDVGNYSLNNTL